MAKTTPVERIKQRYEACVPRSETNQLLLDQYLTRVDLDRPGSTAENEVVVFYEVCRLVTEIDLSVISLRRLLEWSEAGSTKTARKRRQLVVGRLIRILEQDGFCRARERTAKARITAEIDSLASEEAERVRDWIARRRGERVGWYQLSHEARHIALLERCASEAPEVEQPILIRRWLAKIVKQVVDCDCPPVTRYPDPRRCKSCGATIETHGRRPAPGPRKQGELAAIGRRYLNVRTPAWGLV
jgi:hypothetical protein